MLNFDQIRTRLDPVLPELVNGHLAAWDTWQRLLGERPDFARPFGPTERATFLHAHICLEVDRRLTPRGLKLNQALSFQSLAIGSDLLVRFKYLRDGEPHNIQTVQQALLAKQLYNDEMMLSLALEGFAEPPTLVTAGYLLNASETEISRIVVRRDCEGFEAVQYDLYPERAISEPLRFPLVAEDRPARIRSARERAEEEGVGGRHS